MGPATRLQTLLNNKARYRCGRTFENVIPPAELALASDRGRMDLTSALAHSDNPYFERVGSGLGFDKMIHYARELGLGEKTGANVPFEFRAACRK